LNINLQNIGVRLGFTPKTQSGMGNIELFNRSIKLRHGSQF